MNLKSVEIIVEKLYDSCPMALYISIGNASKLKGCYLNYIVTHSEG